LGRASIARGGALLSDFGITAVFHYAPLHYLPFIARRRALLSKAELRRLGFGEGHFRSTSAGQDEQRGFSRYVHLSLDAHPPILRAKLARGFPHFEVSVPAGAFTGIDYLLCRFNIAKTRYFRGAKTEPVECARNGRYQNGMRLPVAKSAAERQALLELNYPQTMVELLVLDELPLHNGTSFRFFHSGDFSCAGRVLESLGVADYQLEIDSQLQYEPAADHHRAVEDAIARALADANWRGSGLEFDRL
jgi:hypothetical protein